jgi:ubiquinone/menaquinone biosynthesis C-methylase UbiE
MGFYSRFILPTVISCGCSAPPITEQRRKLLPRAEGVVLELGIGSGLNLPLYDPQKVVKVYGLEPDSAMRAKACTRAARAPVRVRVLQEPAEEMSLPDQSVDTVVVTFAMCTIPDVPTALRGVRRVLKPGGRLLFCEHGRAPDAAVFRRQQRLEPLWMRLFGGCHLTRDIPRLLQDAGFGLQDLEAGYLPRAPRFAGYVYRGAAAVAR